MDHRPSIRFLLLFSLGIGLSSPLVAASDLRVVFASGKMQVFAQVPATGKPSPREPAPGRVPIHRGDLIWTGENGHVTVAIGGHTQVEAKKGTLFAVLPRTIEETQPRREVDVIYVFLGIVRAETTWKKAPTNLRVRVMASGNSGSTLGGPVTVQADPPPLEGKFDASRRQLGVDIRRALEVVSRPVPFSGDLFSAPRTRSRAETRSQIQELMKKYRQRRESGKKP